MSATPRFRTFSCNAEPLVCIAAGQRENLRKLLQKGQLLRTGDGKSGESKPDTRIRNGLGRDRQNGRSPVCCKRKEGSAVLLPELGAAEQNNIVRAVREICDLVGSDSSDIYSQFLTGPELAQRFSDATSPAEVIALAQTLGAEQD